MASSICIVSLNLKEIIIKGKLSIRPRERKKKHLEGDKQTRFQGKLLFAVLLGEMLSL